MFTKTLSAILIVSTLGLGTAALAQPNPGLDAGAGYITDIDLKEHKVTLSDGVTYQLPSGFALGVFSEGQRVVVQFDQVGGTRLATGMSFAS